MSWLQKTSQTEYPLAGSLSSELQVLEDVPNTESIHAGFESENDYVILPGIREIPMWDGDPHTTFYAANDILRSKELAAEIQQSGMIKPLIVGIDLDGNDYLIEGVHRFVALHLLGKATFPAVVVIEQQTV